MSLKLLHIISIIFFFQGLFLSQNSGSIKGVIMDYENNESLIGASIWVTINDSMIGDISNLNGNFKIDSLSAGKYNLHISFPNKIKQLINSIEVKISKITFTDTIYLTDDYEIILYSIGCKAYYGSIDPESPTTTVITNDIITKISCTRGISYATTDFIEGIITVSGERKINFRGSRDGSFITYFDGMKIEGSAPAVPVACLKSYSVYTGGLPAKYGDTSGGVVVIETKSFFDLYNQRVAEMGIDYK